MASKARNKNAMMNRWVTGCGAGLTWVVIIVALAWQYAALTKYYSRADKEAANSVGGPVRYNDSG